MDIKREIDNIAPMIKTLGYDTQADIPNYGLADDLVISNMKELEKNLDFWNAKIKSYTHVSVQNLK